MSTNSSLYRHLNPVLNDLSDLQSLINRMGLLPSLLRRLEEESIAHLIDIDPSIIETKQAEILGKSSLQEYLDSHDLTYDDFRLRIIIPEALRVFSERCFDDGLEDEFLSSQGQHDQITYSLLRHTDASLVQELWIRIEEGEASFADLAFQYGQVPESRSRGIIGPIAVGAISPPHFASLLRSLRPGEVHPPMKVGQWSVLLRLEELRPARLDDDMRSFLLKRQLDLLLDNRVSQILRGESPDPISSLFHS